jgi:cytochrome c oxidase cbb3-type subunit 3
MKKLLRILTIFMLIVIIPIGIFAFSPKLTNWANQQVWIEYFYLLLIVIAAIALFSGFDLLNRVRIYQLYTKTPEDEKQNFWKNKFSVERLGFVRPVSVAVILSGLVLIVLLAVVLILPKAPLGNWYYLSIKILGIISALGIFMLFNAIVNLKNGKYVILGIPEPISAETKNTKTWQDRLFQLRPTFMDAEVDLKEDFDGITELDNPPPPWFMWLFYGTVITAGIYMVHYAILKNGPNPVQEYNMDEAARQAAKKDYLSKHEGNVDETNVTLLKDKAKLAEAAEIFKQRCVACHGEKGEGKNGPNLTDEYWLHGNSIKDVFKTINNGVLEKGMVAWKGQISPPNIRAVASYVLSLQGSNPAGAKEPQGDKIPAKEKF